MKRSLLNLIKIFLFLSIRRIERTPHKNKEEKGHHEGIFRKCSDIDVVEEKKRKKKEKSFVYLFFYYDSDLNYAVGSFPRSKKRRKSFRILKIHDKKQE